VLIDNRLTKFRGNIFSLSENIAKSFRGYFFRLTLYTKAPTNVVKVVVNLPNKLQICQLDLSQL